MNPILVSVTIPAYNRAVNIERAVDSVLTQSCKPLEVIVVDDGSIDRAAEILDRYNDRIRIIRQRNRDPGAARNAGIELVAGKARTSGEAASTD
jgi:glycosyltransferase EpsH